MTLKESDLERFQELEELAELDGFKRGILADFCKAKLSAREKTIFILRMHGQTFQNIALILNINRKTAYEYYRRTRQKLQKMAKM